MQSPTFNTIENANLDDVIPGDHLTWTSTTGAGGMTLTVRREGIAHHYSDGDGVWCTKDGVWIAGRVSEGVTLTIRRPAPGLPTKTGTTIIPNDGHRAIEITADGGTWYASEAVLGEDGKWHGVWRRARTLLVIIFVDPKLITPGTWKVAGQ